MIIQIRGTSGSGKTWAMRNTIKELSNDQNPMNPVYVKGRKKPLYYSIGNYFILGHYESTCGGCDNIGAAPQIYDLYETVISKFEDMIIIKWHLKFQNSSL